MRPLSAPELLDVWDRGRDHGPLDRALALLAAACPGYPPDVLAALSIGERDARLMLLRQWAFGAHAACVAACPACGAQVELGFALADVCAAGLAPAAPLLLEIDGYAVRFRLPTSHDLRDLRGPAGSLAARQQVLARCVLAAMHAGAAHDGATLPESVVAALVAAMAAADPLADIRLGLICPACGHAWQVLFDIVTFFWSEIDAWARRTLCEVHALARAYGWREAEILALTARRRQHYLEILADERLPR